MTYKRTKAEIKVAFHDIYKMGLCKIKQPFLWDNYYSALRDPKTELGISWNSNIQNEIIKELKSNKVTLKNFNVDLVDYRQYLEKAKYQSYIFYKFKFGFIGNRLAEKTLEHYVAAKLLELSRDDIYVDIASSGSPTPEIYHRLFGCTSYRQDLIFPAGVNSYTIGGNATSLPVKNGFATKLALHCAFEHFEEDSDIKFIKEAKRVLRKGGKLCIIPLYLSNRYSILTDPTVLPRGGISFEEDATLFCSKAYWGNRHGRHYDVPHFLKRIVSNLDDLKLTIFIVQNEKQIDESCYLKFAALFEKG